MNRSQYFFLNLLFLIFSIPAWSQVEPTTAMSVEPVMDIERLVREVFIKEGNCSSVSNIRLVGREEGVGSFSVEQGAISVGVGSGVILSSGNVVDVVGPNQKNNTTSSGPLDSSDDDLRRLSGRDVFDATGIEFDFVPVSDQVSFNYVFASEEYCEFVDQEFNDVFGFFVSGPGLNGNFDKNAINVALIPGTNDQVAINSVNHLRNPLYFIPNYLDIDISECGLPPRLTPLRDVEFDGFTTKLKATIDVVPCQTYSIRLMVGDVSDNILDSGVFLEANSFDLGAQIGITSEVLNREGNTFYEDCLEANFVFERKTLDNRGRPLVVNYRVQGEAINGEDFETISNQIILPSGQRFTRLPIKAIADDNAEGPEKIEIITELVACDCIERDTAVLFLDDKSEDLDLSFDEEWACLDEPFQLVPTITNGVSPYRYKWSTGDTTQSIQQVVDTSTNYALTITDGCDTERDASVTVNIQPKPMATLSGEVAWCLGAQDISLPVSLEGNPPWSLSFQNGAGAVFQIDSIQDNPFALPINTSGEYNLISFGDKNCSGSVEGAGFVTSKSFAVDYQITFPSCKNVSDGAIAISIAGGQAPYEVDWGRASEDPFLLTQVGAGTYPVVITDAEGCIEVLEIDIPAEQLRDRCPFSARDIYVPNAFSPNGDGVNDLFQVYPKPGSFQSVSFQIYDRWGGLIYSSEPYLSPRSGIGWDGGNAAVSVYLCKVEVILGDGRIRSFGRSFQLIR